MDKDKEKLDKLLKLGYLVIVTATDGEFADRYTILVSFGEKPLSKSTIKKLVGN